ncbi:MAG: UDP-N-acetylenolpyruvoylglucosamine reductase [Firmicutes bacterium HGW-Firmicutes-8]|nr:MAG: UDP-N-acetylenolpyruvoylglucosamine reductase [Firmicutes bacterium HGW-Firmicutes-8]
MNLQEVEHHLGRLVKGSVLCMESMQKHTSWRIGGPAEIMVLPASADDIGQCLQFARERHIPLTVMGNGSNLLVKDNGIRGIVLKISRGFNKIVVSGPNITAEAGALVPLVAKKAAEAGLSGLEFAAGIPASIGGAVIMNAGAHGQGIDEVIREVTVLTPAGEMLVLKKEDIGFRYRKSGIDKNLIILQADFVLTPGDPLEIRAKNETNLIKRRRSQPLEYPSAGSVFANPPGQWAGWLIEQVGGKGMRVGDALVSEKHANFIVNVGRATAEDVLQLIAQIKQKVFEKFNIELKLEVQVVGE